MYRDSGKSPPPAMGDGAVMSINWGHPMARYWCPMEAPPSLKTYRPEPIPYLYGMWGAVWRPPRSIFPFRPQYPRIFTLSAPWPVTTTMTGSSKYSMWQEARGPGTTSSNLLGLPPQPTVTCRSQLPLPTYRQGSIPLPFLMGGTVVLPPFRSSYRIPKSLKPNWPNCNLRVVGTWEGWNSG